MKFLFDENLSPALPPILAELYPNSTHVRDVGLARADDENVWVYAREHGMAIISKDSDFRQRSFLLGHPPKVVWIRRGNCSTHDIESILQQHYHVILEFDRDELGALLNLD